LKTATRITVLSLVLHDIIFCVVIELVDSIMGLVKEGTTDPSLQVAGLHACRSTPQLPAGDKCSMLS